MRSMRMISVRDVSKEVIPSFRIHKLSFQVDQGEIVSLLGPNGVGKTSIVRLLSGIYQPEAGLISVNGRNLAEHSEAARRQVGVVPDRLPEYPWLSVIEYLEFCASLFRLDATWSETAHRYLDYFQLRSHGNKTLRQLSHGMKQKLNVVRALLHAPNILILDEPTLGLDPISSTLLGRLLTDFATSGRSVLLFTHDLLFASKISDRVLFLRDGSIAQELNLRTLEALYEIDFVPFTSVATINFPPQVSIRVYEDRCYRASYTARQDDILHQTILQTLIQSESRIVGVSVDPLNYLEGLYLTAVEGGSQ